MTGLKYALIDKKNKIHFVDFYEYMESLKGNNEKSYIKKVKDTYVKRQQCRQQQLGKNSCDVYHISTVFIGIITHNNPLFETIIFDNNISSDNYGNNVYEERHSITWKEANIKHQEIVKNLRKKFKQDGIEVFKNVLKTIKNEN